MDEVSVKYNRPVEDINRRGLRRTVPMEVICPAFGRSGTDSLKRALETLGYRNVYHGAEALYENTLDLVMWEEAIRAKYDLAGKPYGRAEFDQLLGHCMATTDWPCCMFSPELIQAYPEAKVVLSIRDVDAWYESVSKTIFTRMSDRWLWFIRQFEWHLRLQANTARLGFDRFFGGRDWHKAAKRRYIEHNLMIQGLVPSERLLVWRVEQGWKPLCDFLDKPVPEVEFPSGNQAPIFFARIQQYNQERMRRAYLNLGVVAALTVMGVGMVVAVALSGRWRQHG